MNDELKENIAEGTAELLDVAMDQILESEILKEIPIIGLAVRMAYAAGSVRDRLFARKVQQFLDSLPKIEEREREQFRTKLEQDATFRAKVGEVLVLTLENMNALDKADILATLFDRLSREKLTLAQFYRLSAAINAAHIGDLLQMIGKPSQTYGYSNDYLLYLVGTGLAEYVPNTSRKTSPWAEPDTIDVKLNIELTKLGSLFIRSMKD